MGLGTKEPKGMRDAEERLEQEKMNKRKGKILLNSKVFEPR